MVMIWLELCTIIAPVVVTTSIILSSNKHRMETFWYQLIQAYLEKWQLNRRKRERYLFIDLTLFAGWWERNAACYNRAPAICRYSSLEDPWTTWPHLEYLWKNRSVILNLTYSYRPVCSLYSYNFMWIFHHILNCLSFFSLTATFPGRPGLASTIMYLHSGFHWSQGWWREVVATTGAVGRAKLQSNRHHQQTTTPSFIHHILNWFWIQVAFTL